jgi:REP element-mobilizing transposase RayT
MPVGFDTYATRRHLPHLQKPGKSYFVTFTTLHRTFLVPAARDIAFTTIAREHNESCYCHTFVVMPDHVHWVFTPDDSETLSEILQRVKSVSSHNINKLLHHRGTLWQDESFDSHNIEQTAASPRNTVAGRVVRPDRPL